MTTIRSVSFFYLRDVVYLKLLDLLTHSQILDGDTTISGITATSGVRTGSTGVNKEILERYEPLWGRVDGFDWSFRVSTLLDFCDVEKYEGLTNNGFTLT